MEEAKEHTSSLDKLSKGNVFEVPSHYFDSLAKRIEERMLAGNTSNSLKKKPEQARTIKKRYLKCPMAISRRWKIT